LGDKTRKRLQQSWRFVWHNLEAFVWAGALISLAIHNPEAQHYTFCPIKNLGFEFCPGCGLGHAISYFFHGEFTKSFYAHPLGVFAIVLLIYRIILIFRNYWIDYKLIHKT
jgi:hypothetical protein